MAKITQRGADVVVWDDTDNEVLVIGSDGKLTLGDASPAAVAALTGAFGTTGNAIVDAGAAYNQANLNNNFRRLEDKVNALLTALQNAGIVG